MAVEEDQSMNFEEMYSAARRADPMLPIPGVEGMRRREEAEDQDTKATGADRPPTRRDASRPDASPERIEEIRQKILDGAYNSLENIEQVARRILSSGDY